MASVSQWVLGDLACQVETRYGEASLRNYAEEIGVDPYTLQSYRTVSKAYPQISRRLEISWSRYTRPAAEDDRLELIAGDLMTVREARDLTRERADRKRKRERRAELRERKKQREAAAAEKKKTRKRRPAAAAAADTGQPAPADDDRIVLNAGPRPALPDCTCWAASSPPLSWPSR